MHSKQITKLYDLAKKSLLACLLQNGLNTKKHDKNLEIPSSKLL